MITIYENNNVEIMVEKEIYDKIPNLIDRIYYVYKSRVDIYDIIDFTETIKDILYCEDETEFFTNKILDELEILEESYFIEFK